MERDNKILYIFDLENTQSSYMQAAEIISILESNHHEDTHAPFERLVTLLKTVEVSGCKFNYRGSKAYIEEPLNPGDLGFVRTAKPVIADQVKKSILNRNCNVYHLRIHMQHNIENHVVNLFNLQYLALLIKRFEQIEWLNTNIQEKLSVFVVPSTGKYYPFTNTDGQVDFETYNEVSQYLRLLAKENTGIIYGVTKNTKHSIAVRALNFKKITKIREAFPLIPFAEAGYEALFEKTVSTKDINTLFSLRKNSRYGYANHKNPNEAISDFVVESAYRKIMDSLKNHDCSNKLNSLKSTLFDYSKTQEITVMTFGIFGLMFNLDNTEIPTPLMIKQRVEHQLKYASDLCAGLSQIAQNSLQYSELKAGILALQLCQTPSLPSHDYLEFCLSDYNSKFTLVDTFITNLSQDISHTENEDTKKAYQGLTQHKDHISLSDFFGLNDNQSAELKQAWKAFRRADTSAHVGLAIFFLAVQKYSGSIQIVSSTANHISEKNKYCHIGKFADESALPNFEDATELIPGTRITVRLPLNTTTKTHNGMGQLFSADLKEDYGTFAYYLNWRVEQIKLSLENAPPSVHSTLISNADIKRCCVAAWERMWRHHLRIVEENSPKSQIIYCCDLSQTITLGIDTSDSCEIFLKGFFNALNVFSGDGPYCLAFCAVSKLFIQVLKRLCISLAPKTFPKGLQLYAYCADDITTNILLCGETFYQAVNASYQLSLEHGTHSFDLQERIQCRQLYNKTVGDIASHNFQTITKTVVCPFDVILSSSENDITSVFFRRIEHMAELPLDDYSYGYKLNHTHMRLGNKVHIRSFYEMSFLFYRTAVSNRLAFAILRDLRNEVDILNDALLFYGYASYSKALLTAILEITTAYRKLSGKSANETTPLAISSYQHNLQTEPHVEETQIYFDFSNSSIGEVESQNQIKLDLEVKVIQIVPISSTLTTFGKMQRKLEDSLIECSNKIGRWINYTMFWVVDEDTEAKKTDHTNRRYFQLENISKHLIKVFGSSEEDEIFFVKYFMKASAVWHTPLACKLCYPDNPVLEVPLVETDQTSTIPTQQIRIRKTHIESNSDKRETNNDRIQKLKTCIRYGHIRREQNHFNLYIDTQKYFNIVGEDLKIWLKKERNKTAHEESAILNIIFSPEHSTNVGFAQYVNNYYFDGNAEIVCINEDKQYRSNFICEHMALIESINVLLDEAETTDSQIIPVHFYFVDDTIVSGGSFHKANSFLRSLIPLRHRGKYPTNLFSKCFLLIDRLSQDSKTAYVCEPDKNFISYVHLDISNMRVQGDSCVGCKEHQNALRLLKRSATKNGEKHWKKKLIDSEVIRFDDEDKLHRIEGQEHAFQRLVLSHILQNFILGENDTFTIGKAYDAILVILATLLQYKPPKGIEKEIKFNYANLLDSIKSSSPIKDVMLLIELLSRPFFSFDFKIRLQVQSLLLLWAEHFLGTPVLPENIDLNQDFLDYKGFLLDGERLNITNNLAIEVTKQIKNNNELATFFQDCIMAALVELRSTYLIRLNTFQKIYKLLKKCCIEQVKNFLTKYSLQIQQLLDETGDETKSLWLEHILIAGKEYDSESKRDNPEQPLAWLEIGKIKEYSNDETQQRNALFLQFGQEVFLQNSRILFDGLEELINNDQIGDYHFMDRWNQFRKWDLIPNPDFSNVYKSEKELFNTIKEALSENDENKIYNNLLAKISSLARKKYFFNDPDVACLTLDEECYASEMQAIDIVFKNFTKDERLKPYQIKERFLRARNNSLKEYGYYLGYDSNTNGKPSCYYTFIIFNHPESTCPTDETSPLPVCLYFGFNAKDMQNPLFYLMMFLRDILSYRNRLQRIFDKHFSGKAISKYAHTVAQREIVAHEKAVSHNTTSDDRAALEVLQNQSKVGNYKYLDSSQVSKWLLLRSYINSQIAKLFNRTCIQESESGNQIINEYSAPPLYVDYASSSPSLWRERPLRAFYDLCLDQDNRFSLLGTAVKFNYDPKLRHARFVCNLRNKNKRYYNAEFFRCILIDIYFTAMKYKADSKTFLEYIDRYLMIEQDMKNKSLLPKETIDDRMDQRCVIQLKRVPADSPDFDYLVIRNEVSCEAHGIYDLKRSNERICARLRDPLDYPDGHLSLLTISRYIETLDPLLREKCKFNYVTAEKLQTKGQKHSDNAIFFESWLPVFEKED